MKSLRFAVLLVACLFVVASCNSARIKGNVAMAPEGKHLVVKELNGSERVAVDSMAVGADGSFDCRLKMKKDSRNFYFLYYKERKIASLILSPGETVELVCDTLGNWTVNGSPECEALRRNELALAAVSRLDPLTMKDYIAHHRKMLAYVMENSHSLTIVPVLFQKIGDIPVFGQDTDGVIFAGAADSLQTVYPSSQWIALLRSSAKEKLHRLNLKEMVKNAGSAMYPEIDLPDVNGERKKLSDCTGSKTLIVFWDASDVNNKLFNQDVLLPAYEQYRKSGLKIYQVGILSDKSTWATAVRRQAMEWTSVFDAQGSTIETYHLSSLPAVFLVGNATLKRIENPGRKAILDALK